MPLIPSASDQILKKVLCAVEIVYKDDLGIKRFAALVLYFSCMNCRQSCFGVK